jgi:hypothetical protein
MSYVSGFLIPVVTAGTMLYTAAAIAQDTTKTRFTPRELFYMAAPEKSPQKAKAKAAPPKVQPANPPSTPQTSTAQTKGTRPPVVASQGGAVVVPAALQTAPAPASGPALGLKYSILKNVGGKMEEVAPDTVFRARDGIQLKVETNVPGYLYVVNRGSSGTWKPMFPAPEIAGGDNRVQGWREYVLPGGNHNMVFDQQPGIENLFIVFSLVPVPDFEELIYSLQGEKTTPAAQPASPRPARDKQLIALAKVSIDDATVGRLRTTYSRDLIIEKVSLEPPGEMKQTAVYVVNPTGSPDSRLVADLKLVHQ